MLGRDYKGGHGCCKGVGRVAEILFIYLFIYLLLLMDKVGTKADAGEGLQGSWRDSSSEEVMS